jgi:uncharacterized membrane protein
MTVRTTFAIAALGTLCQPALAKPTIQTVDVPGESFTQLVGINDTGVIAGNVVDTNTHGVIRAVDGTFTIFDPPGSAGTNVNAIDAAGDTVGYYSTGAGTQCFIRSAAGAFTVFGRTSGSRPYCFANAINDKGYVAGTATKGRSAYAFLRTSSGGTRAFLKSDKTATGVFGVNNVNTVVGFTTGASSTVGYLRTKDGTITTFDAPGDTYGTRATGINDKGTITGTFSTSSVDSHGFIREADGTVTAFDVPNATLTSTVSINAKGDIAGNYRTASVIGGFVRSAKGDIKTFAPKGFTYTLPLQMNSSGVVVGEYEDAQSNVHGFIRTP